MRKGHRDIQEIREIVLLCLGCGVFVVWSIAVLTALFFGRPMDAQVHAVMLAAETGLFGGAYLAGRKADRNGKDSNGA